MLTTLRHLEAALSYSSPTGGTCFHRSAALMLDMPGATLVFGINRAATPEEILRDPRSSPVPFIHAWVEHNGQLFAPTLIERMDMQLRPISIEKYYKENGVLKTWRLPYDRFMVLAKRWKLSSSFKHGGKRAGNRQVTDALLDAAGVKYVKSDRNTVLPDPALLRKIQNEVPK